MPAMERRKIARTVYLIFTKQHGLHVQTDATRFLEELLQNDPNPKDTMEKIVRTYKKRNEDQPAVIVDKTSLQEIVTMMQTSAATAADPTPFQRVEEDMNDSFLELSLDSTATNPISTPEPFDITRHFKVINAFDMPRWQFHRHRNQFIKAASTPALLGSAKDKGDMFFDRFEITRQRLLRNETFWPSPDKDTFLKITPIKALIGHDTEHFLLFGMLTQIEEGKIFLEDEDAHIELDLSEASYGPGLFTDGTLVLAEGIYGDDHLFHVHEIGFPPAERREMSDVLFSHVNFLGLPKPLVEEHILKTEETSRADISFVILSDVWLDQPKVLRALYTIFEGYAKAQIPLAFILIGNFSSQTCTFTSTETTQYRDNFNALADLIAEFPALATHSYFVLVPGLRDPWGGATLPQPPIPEVFTSRMRQKVRRVIFATNPCRLRYCTQDLVIFREDLLNRLWRNTLLSPRLDDEPEPVKHLIHTVVDQSHLCPLPLSVRPIYWSLDHALRLYPLPQAIILADKCDSYGLTYEGTHCMNPSSFPNAGFSWRVYYPNKRTSERCALPS